MSKNKLVISGTTINGSDIISGNNNTSHAMVGESLAADQLSCVISTEDEPFYPADSDSPLITADSLIYYAKNPIDVTSFKGGEDALYYDGDTLMGKYYLERVTQIGVNRYKISATSIIGKLLNSRHYGGVYSQIAASQIFSDILSGVSYTLDSDVSATTVTGYLPIASRRDNLQQVLMAVGATIKIDNSGVMHISAMSSVSTGYFDASRCFVGGSVESENQVDGVQLTEHNYFKAGNTVTLFSDGVDGTELIEFSEPYHDLSITGGTIMESGANYAKISAKGTVTLTGQPYTHVTRIVTAGNTSTTTNNVKNVSNFTLANPQIAQSLVERLYLYLKCNVTISQDVLVGSERAGDVVSVINPYTMLMQSATIKEFNTTMSAVNRASAKFLVGFVPQGTISGFTRYILLTGSGSFTVPDGVYKLRLIIVGAGGGGSGGKRGSAGGDSKEQTPGSGGAGGAGGTPGTGGKVFEISIDVTPGQVLNFACGVHGNGGLGETDTQAQSNGTAGTATTIHVYSSENGRSYPYGYFEAKTGLTFAADGAPGYAGGRGGDGSDNYDIYAEPIVYGKNGESVQNYAGGRGGPPRMEEISERNAYRYAGGGGGGAAFGQSGGDAPGWSNYSSAGGQGATGITGADGASYGQGGGAGHGGGGGGGGGIGYHWNPLFTSSYFVGSGGQPGNGTNGGNGGDGCIVIYY